MGGDKAKPIHRTVSFELVIDNIQILKNQNLKNRINEITTGECRVKFGF